MGFNQVLVQRSRLNFEAVTVLGRFVCSALRFIPPKLGTKGTHSIYLQCFQQRAFLKYRKKKFLKIEIPHSNGRVTSFDVNTAHMIRETAKLLVDYAFIWN